MTTVIRSIVLAAALVFANGLFAAAPASANIKMVTIINKSDRCAWMTIYWAPDPYIQQYRIAEMNAEVKPRFLRPGEIHRFPTGDVAALKIRAEVTKNADCSGGTIKDTYDIRTNNNRDVFLNAHLMNTGNGYNLWFY